MTDKANTREESNTNNPVDRLESDNNPPGSAGDTPNDSGIEDPRNVAPGDGSLQDTSPTRSS